MIIIPNVNKENSCLDCPVWSLCWDNKPTEDICKDRCPIVEFEGVELFDDMPTIEAEIHSDTESWKTTVTDLTPVEYAPVKHGRWIYINGWVECSCCHSEPPNECNLETNYCPNCGAKMDEKTLTEVVLEIADSVMMGD